MRPFGAQWMSAPSSGIVLTWRSRSIQSSGRIMRRAMMARPFFPRRPLRAMASYVAATATFVIKDGPFARRIQIHLSRRGVAWACTRAAPARSSPAAMLGARRARGPHSLTLLWPSRALIRDWARRASAPVSAPGLGPRRPPGWWTEMRHVSDWTSAQLA